MLAALFVFGVFISVFVVVVVVSVFFRGAGTYQDCSSSVRSQHLPANAFAEDMSRVGPRIARTSVQANVLRHAISIFSAGASA